MSALAALFAELQPDFDPRHIEAYVRLEYPTLAHLPRSTLAREARIAADCIRTAGEAEAESLAQSFGLVERSAA